MNLVSKVFLWRALHHGCLVAAQEILPASRVFFNSTSITSSIDVSTSKPFVAGPSHGPTKPSTLMSASLVITVIGGHTVTDGTYVDSMGDTVTVPTSFSLSPVGVSIGLPTITESSLPWTGRILTEPGFKTSIISSSLVTASSTISPLATSTSMASNATSSKWTNTTQSFTTSSASTNISNTSTSPIVMTTPGNLTIATSLTSDRGNLSRTVVSSVSATYSLFQNVSTCSTLSPGQPVTIWSILPNITTTTMTVTGNWSTSMTPLPEFTPPVYCPTNLDPSTSTSNPSIPSNKTSSPLSLSISTTVPLFIGAPHPTSKTTDTLTDSLGMSSTIIYIPGYTSAEETTNGGNRVTVTSVTTSRNGVTEITSVTLPNYENGKTDKATVDPSTIPSDSVHWVPQTEPPHSRPSIVSTSSTPDQFAPTPITTIFAGDPAATTPLTEVIGGITVVAAPSKATIGSQTVNIGPTPQTVTESGQVFTVLPNEIDGPSVIISIPTYTPGEVFVQNPSPTTVNGVSIDLDAGGGSSVVIDGTFFNLAPDASKQTIVDKGQTIVVGSGGIAFESTTITPAPAPPAAATSTPTNIAVVGGSIITAVGSSIAVIVGQTFTYGPSTPQTTTLFNGELITIAPAGIIFHGSTIGGTALSPSSSQIGIVGGVSITEVGSSLAIISGTTFTIGPGATPTTAIIASQIVSAGPDGFSDGSFTWNPFPPATAAKTLTAGSVTFSELGSSLVVIGSKTFTFGPGAKPTTDVYAGQTISIGPNGIGFSSTTFTSLGVVSTGSESGSVTETGTAANAAKTTSNKNGGGRLRPGLGSGVLGLCMCVVVGFVIL